MCSQMGAVTFIYDRRVMPRIEDGIGGGGEIRYIRQIYFSTSDRGSGDLG
jgi:hypothetical protein